MNLNSPADQSLSPPRLGLGGLIPQSSPSVDVSTLLGPDDLGARSPAAPSPRQFSPGLLLRYKWSILGLFVLVAVPLVAGIWVLLVPKYKATAIIEVSPVIPQLLAGKTDMVPLYESYRGSQADFITNAVVLNGVLDDAQVRQTRWYRATPASPLEALLDRLHLRSPGPPLDRLNESLKADVPKNKQLIFVSMTAPIPGEAKLIVDKVLERYVRFANERASASENELMGKLRKEIGDREIELRGLEETAAQLRQQLGTGAPEDLVRERALAMLRLEATINALQTDLEVARRTLDTVPGKTAQPVAQPAAAATAATGTVETPATSASVPLATQPGRESRYALDVRWQQLNDRATVARREVERREARFGESDPRLADLRRERDDADAELGAWEVRLDQVGPTRPPDNNPGVLRESVQQMTVRLELLTRQLEEERQTARSVFTDAEKLAQKTAARGKTDEMRQQLERRLEEMRMNREVAGLVRTFPAIEPAEPDNDRRWKLMAAAAVGALVLSVGFAFLRIKLSPTVDQVVEISRPVQRAFLGHLPLERSRPALPPEQSPTYLEAVRLIRTALLNRLGGALGVTVQITSATIGAGKSTLAVLLARSLAQGGLRVLLVDTDMRRPTLAARFAINPVPGLRDVLAGQEVATGIQDVASIPGLSVLPAGSLACYADRELMANGVFSALLNKWRGQYDIVLLDGAPLLGLADASILAGRADGSVLVVRERHCRREAVLEALAMLGAAGGKLLGTVFVGSGGAGGYGHGYAYGYGYGYESRPDKPAPPGPVPPGAASGSDAARLA